MTRKIPTANRRNVIKALGGGAAAAGLGGAALLASTGAATAASVSISGTSVTLDDGDVGYVDLTVDDYTASWDGFDVPVAAVAYRDVLEAVNSSASHVLFDQKGVDQQPIKLSAISSQGNSGDGWGGSDEYATVSSPSTSGAVHASVDWRILSSDGTGAKSIETPGDTDDFGIDVTADGGTEETRLQLRKQVWFYRLAGTDETPDLQTQDDTGVILMGGQDGTKEKAEAVAEFGVTVKNQASTSGTSGSGTTNAG